MTTTDDPSAQPELVQMWRSAINKARQEIPPPPVQPTALVITMDGVALPLVVGHAGILPVTFPCRILGCRMYAGVFDPAFGPQPLAATAAINLRLSQAGAWAGASQPLYAGTMPTLTAAVETDVSIAGWITELQPGDILPYSLSTFVGTATFVVLMLNVLRLDTRGIGLAGVTDGSGANFTNATGARYTSRG
jgi:hypothetical protein